MKLFLRDRTERLVEWWEKLFADELFEEDPQVHISQGDIFEDGPWMKSESIVSPANSFGFMDGGLDFVFSEFFSWKLQDKLREQIHYDEILVGSAELVDIHTVNPNSPIRWLISAPTMRIPTEIGKTVNAYLATRAALKIAKENNIGSILFSGMGTGVGKIDPSVCAIQMYEAWKRRDKHKAFPTLSQAVIYQYNMLNPQLYLQQNELEKPV